MALFLFCDFELQGGEDLIDESVSILVYFFFQYKCFPVNCLLLFGFVGYLKKRLNFYFRVLYLLSVCLFVCFCWLVDCLEWMTLDM